MKRENNLGRHFASVMLTFAVCAGPLQAQENDVRAAIEQIFEGMRTANADMVRAVFAPGSRFSVIDTQDVQDRIASKSPDGWFNSIGESEGRWDEQVYDVEIQVDENMASAWVPYTFYLDGNISHCGINSIELLMDSERWKVTQIADTRRRDDCPDPLSN